MTGIGGATQVCFDSGCLKCMHVVSVVALLTFSKLLSSFCLCFFGFASASPRFLVRSFVFALAFLGIGVLGDGLFLWRSRQWKMALRLLYCAATLNSHRCGRVHAPLPRLSPFLLPFWEQQVSTWFSWLPVM